MISVLIMLKIYIVSACTLQGRILAMVLDIGVALVKWVCHSRVMHETARATAENSNICILFGISCSVCYCSTWIWTCDGCGWYLIHAYSLHCRCRWSRSLRYWRKRGDEVEPKMPSGVAMHILCKEHMSLTCSCAAHSLHSIQHTFRRKRRGLWLNWTVTEHIIRFYYFREKVY